MWKLERFLSMTAMAIAAMVNMSGTARAVDEVVCTIENYRHVCADGARNPATIAKAMGNPQSLENLRKVRGFDLFETGMQREYFRRSLEKNRADLVNHADRVFLQHMRKRISDEERAMVEAWLANGMNVYARGLYLYREVTWQKDKLSRFSEQPDRPPAPYESPGEPAENATGAETGQDS